MHVRWVPHLQQFLIRILYKVKVQNKVDALSRITILQVTLRIQIIIQIL